MLKLLYWFMRRQFGTVPGWLTVFSARMPLAYTNWMGKVYKLNKKLTPSAVRPRGNVVRLVIAAALLAALERKGDIRCRVDVGEEAVVSVACADAEGPLELSADVLAVAGAADIRVHTEGHGISVAFPRAGATRMRTHERA